MCAISGDFRKWGVGRLPVQYLVASQAKQNFFSPKYFMSRLVKNRTLIESFPSEFVAYQHRRLELSRSLHYRDFCRGFRTAYHLLSQAEDASETDLLARIHDIHRIGRGLTIDAIRIARLVLDRRSQLEVQPIPSIDDSAVAKWIEALSCSAP